MKFNEVQVISVLTRYACILLLHFILDEEYRERLRPPSRNESFDFSKKRKNRQEKSEIQNFRKAMRNLVQSAFSDSDDQKKRKLHKNKKKHQVNVGQGRVAPPTEQEEGEEQDMSGM